jgi:hypothetical protein
MHTVCLDLKNSLLNNALGEQLDLITCQGSLY